MWTALSDKRQDNVWQWAISHRVYDDATGGVRSTTAWVAAICPPSWIADKMLFLYGFIEDRVTRRMLVNREGFIRLTLCHQRLN